jgi:hypothetical protein
MGVNPVLLDFFTDKLFRVQHGFLPE